MIWAGSDRVWWFLKCQLPLAFPACQLIHLHACDEHRKEGSEMHRLPPGFQRTTFGKQWHASLLWKRHCSGLLTDVFSLLKVGCLKLGFLLPIFFPMMASWAIIIFFLADISFQLKDEISKLFLKLEKKILRQITTNTAKEKKKTTWNHPKKNGLSHPTKLDCGLRQGLGGAIASAWSGGGGRCNCVSMKWIHHAIDLHILLGMSH